MNDGTQRTSRRSTVHSRPVWLMATSGRSPIAVQRCSTPSAHAMRSSHGLTLIRSVISGWLCHVQPLSTMIESVTAPRKARHYAVARDCRLVSAARARTLS